MSFYSIKIGVFFLLFTYALSTTPLYAQSKFNTNTRDWTIGLSMDYLWADVNGKARFNSTGIKGDRFSYSDFDLDEKGKGIPVFNFYFGTYAHQLHFEYMQYDLEGVRSLNKNLTVNGNSYVFNQLLAVDHSVQWGRVYYEFFDQQSNVAYGLLLGVENYTFEYKIRPVKGSTSDRFKTNVVNPLVGGHCIFGQGRYNVKLSAFYVPKVFDIIDYDTLDLSASLVFNFGDYLQIEGGYRYVDTTVESSKKDNYENIKLKGIYATLRIRF